MADAVWEDCHKIIHTWVSRRETIRCKLLLGLSVIVASCSNPILALTRSRRLNRAVPGSPFRNSVAASFSNACAKAGSRLDRKAAVQYDFR
jgi:hypothetical protein